jgi:hypothetical protein
VSVEARAVVVLPTDWYERYRRSRLKMRDVLLAEVTLIEQEFDLPPTVRAQCPQCDRVWNKRAG